MKYKVVFKFVLLLFIICKVCFAQTDELMDRAVKEYLRGDYLGAIQDFERVLELEENEKARRLLYKSIVDEGKRRKSSNEFDKAEEYFAKAFRINPNDREVADLLSEVGKKLGNVSAAKRMSGAAVDILQDKVAKERKEKITYKGKLKNIVFQRDKLKNELNDYKKKFEESRNEVIKQTNLSRKKQNIFSVIALIIVVLFTAIGGGLVMVLRKVFMASSESKYQLNELQQKFDTRMKEAEKESDELEQKVAKSINNMLEEQHTVVKRMAISASGRAQNDIEEIKEKLDSHFLVQQEKLIDLLNQQAHALSTEKTEKVELGDRVITDVNPHVRARADSVELIPKTITDPNVAEKMLKPYLTDTNNRVRGNACVAIYQYNPELAVATIDKMASSHDKWMRLSAAWAIGEIASPDAIRILRKLLDDIDEKVKNRAIMAFESMAEVKEDVAKEIRSMIDRIKKPGEG